jgi:hypothetical protein
MYEYDWQFGKPIQVLTPEAPCGADVGLDAELATTSLKYG